MKAFVQGFTVGLALLVAIILIWMFFPAGSLVLGVLLGWALSLGIGGLLYGLAMGFAFRFSIAVLIPLLAGAAYIAYTALGLTGLWMVLLALAMPLAATRIGWRLKLRFWEIAGLGTLSLVLGLLGAYLVLTVAIGDPLEALAGLMTEVPEIPGVDAEELETMISLSLLALRDQLPSLSLQMALLGGVSMAYLPVAMERRRGVELLQLPDMDHWIIPRWARISLLAIFVLALFSTFSGWAFSPMFYASSWMLLILCFSIQGYAAGHHILKRMGVRKGWRTAILIAVFCIAETRTLLAILGILDGWLIPRKPIGAPVEPANDDKKT